MQLMRHHRAASNVLRSPSHLDASNAVYALFAGINDLYHIEHVTHNDDDFTLQTSIVRSMTDQLAFLYDKTSARKFVVFNVAKPCILSLCRKNLAETAVLHSDDQYTDPLQLFKHYRAPPPPRPSRIRSARPSRLDATFQAATITTFQAATITSDKVKQQSPQTASVSQGLNEKDAIRAPPLPLYRGTSTESASLPSLRGYSGFQRCGS